MTTKDSSTTPIRIHKRDHSLDFLRGAAVFFMIVTHVNAFFYPETGTWLDFFTWWGATICFTVFLFVSGSITGMTIKKSSITRMRALRRGASLLGTYYFIAFFMAFFNENIRLSLSSVFEILTFQIIPEFTEFLLPFVFFPMLVAAALPVLRKNKKNPLFLLSISFITYGLAYVLHKVDWGGGYLTTLKGIFVGEGELHRFPLLSYLPVYTIGMWWGLRNREDKRSERNLTKTVLFFSISIYLLLLLTGMSEWYRWPPSVLFFCYGFIFIFGIILVHDILRKVTWLQTLLAYFGRYAISYYIAHLIILVILKHLIITDMQDEVETVALIIFTFSTSTIYVLASNLSKFFIVRK